MSSTDLALKMRQISSLKSTFSNTIETVKDSTFKIPISSTLSLLISLPVNFPGAAPSFFIEGYNNHLLYSHPSVWNTLTNLSKYTMEIFQQISSQPNILKDYESRLSSNVNRSPPPAYGGSTNLASSNSSSTASPSTSTAGLPPPPYKDPTPVSTASSLPSIPKSFPDLKTKSKEELEALLANPDIDNYLFTFDEVSNMAAQIERLVEQSTEVSQKNETLQTKVIQLKSDLEEKRKLYLSKQDDFNILKVKKASYDNQNSINALLEKLSDLIVKSEIESDNLTNSFVDGEIEFKEYKKKFKEIRMQYHSRSAIKEKQLHSLNYNI